MTVTTESVRPSVTCEEVVQEREWVAVDGGVDRACRGKSAGDNLASYFTVNSVRTWETLKDPMDPWNVRHMIFIDVLWSCRERIWNQIWKTGKLWENHQKTYGRTMQNVYGKRENSGKHILLQTLWFLDALGISLRAWLASAPASHYAKIPWVARAWSTTYLEDVRSGPDLVVLKRA